jgi:hypothetical protein
LKRLRSVREWRLAAAPHCGTAGKNTKPLTREQALRVITENGVTACPYCRPDTSLGAL